jgi:hypothetical protein
MATLNEITINLRVLIGGKGIPMWRLNALGFFARLLRVPVEVK